MQQAATQSEANSVLIMVKVESVECWQYVVSGQIAGDALC